MKSRIINRLTQISGELISEGWIKVGGLGKFVLCFRHPNGNRMLIGYSRGYVYYLKNGLMIKKEPLTLP